MTARTVELNLSGVMDAGFEVSGVLLPAAYRGPLLATFLPEQALDWAQRAESEAAARHVRRATQFQRQGNGLLERAMDGLRALVGTGKWKGLAS